VPISCSVFTRTREYGLSAYLNKTNGLNRGDYRGFQVLAENARAMIHLWIGLSHMLSFLGKELNCYRRKCHIYKPLWSKYTYRVHTLYYYNTMECPSDLDDAKITEVFCAYIIQEPFLSRFRKLLYSP
jgi:hypothetical protein